MTEPPQVGWYLDDLTRCWVRGIDEVDQKGYVTRPKTPRDRIPIERLEQKYR